MIAVDGAMLNPDRVRYGGYMQNAAGTYAIMRAIVEPRMKQSPPVRMEVDGSINGDELSVTAAVKDASEELLPSLRLRLAIAEGDVEAMTQIGLWHHHMVVREMLGGARGIAPRKGELKYSFTMPVSDIQRHLDDYLNRYQSGKGYKFPEQAIPPVKGPLYLVAWVQNDKVDEQRSEIGRAVLQTVVVPLNEPVVSALSPANASTPDSEKTGDSKPAETEKAP
jgi:hypothetical protein